MEDAATIKDLVGIIQNVFHVVVRLAGVAVFIMFIIGGIQYLTSGGNPEKTKGAQGTLTYAVAGLVLIILGWFILLFIEKFTGVKVTEFKIGN